MGRRGAGRWTEAPAGVQLGLIVGLALAAFVWAGAGWMAFVLLFWSLPGWIDRAVPGGVRRILRAIRRRPAIGILPLAAPLSMLHLLIPAEQAGGEAPIVGVLAGLLLPFVLGIWPDRTRSAAPSRLAGQAQGAVPGFVKPAAARIANVGPALLTLVGAAIAVIGTFLPWAWFALPGLGTVTADGLYGDDPMTSDGAFALALGIAIFLVATARLGARGQAGWRRGVAIAGGLGLIMVAFWHEGMLATQIGAFLPPASGTIGPGIGVVAFGGAIAFVGGLLPGRPAPLPTDFLSVSATPFSGAPKQPRQSPFAHG